MMFENIPRAAPHQQSEGLSDVLPHTSVSRVHLREISNQPFTSQHLYKEHNISPPSRRS